MKGEEVAVVVCLVAETLSARGGYGAAFVDWAGEELSTMQAKETGPKRRS